MSNRKIAQQWLRWTRWADKTSFSANNTGTKAHVKAYIRWADMMDNKRSKSERTIPSKSDIQDKN